MYTTVSAEFQFFLLSIVSGLATAFLYDILRISRRIVPVNDIVINAEDIFFFVFVAAFVFCAAYLKNSGRIRWQSFLGLGLGIGLYIFIVRNRLLNLSTVIIGFAVKIIGFLIKVFLFPVRLIMKILQKPISIVAWYTGRSLNRVKSTAKSRSIKLRLLSKNLKSMFSRK